MATYAGTEPGAPTGIATDINPLQVTNAKVTWTPPANTGGMSISSYRILVRSVTGMYYETAECDGTDPTIRDSQECNI